MYCGTNPTALRSQNELGEALLALMKAGPYSTITITMVAQRAGLSRQTFYQVFEDKDDAVRFLIQKEYASFEQAMVQHEAFTYEQFVEYVLTYFEAKRDLLNILTRNNLHHLLQEQFVVALAKVLSLFRCEPVEVKDEEALVFVAGGLCALVLNQADTPPTDASERRLRARRFASLVTIEKLTRID